MHDINLFENKVKVWIPDDFCENTELIEKRYPFKNRPTFIKTDISGEVFISFNLFAKQLSSFQVTSAAVSIKNLIRKVYPYNDQIILKCFQTQQSLQGVSFSFHTIMSFGKQLTDLFLFSIHGQLMIGTVSYPEEYQYKWNTTVLNVKRAVQEIKL